MRSAVGQNGQDRDQKSLGLNSLGLNTREVLPKKISLGKSRTAAIAAHRAAFKGAGGVIAYPPCGAPISYDAAIKGVSGIKCQITAVVCAN